MQFMIIVPADASTEAGQMPTEHELSDMTAYNEQLLAAGVLVAGEGLHPASKGARISWDDGEPRIVDGPFAESKELIAGFTIIDVSSKEEALEWVKKWPASCAPRSGQALELRQVFAAEDFGDELTPELKEREAKMREQAARTAAQG